LKWFFDRLKDRVPPEASQQDLDYLVRSEVKSIYSEFRDHPSGFPFVSEYADPSGDRFREDLERADEARECLEQLPKPIRELLEDIYSLDAEEMTREELAKKLGIKRNTLDQRISRAMRAIRLRLKR
jgi:RNA polymerase sigma factor (sigma-70 family)